MTECLAQTTLGFYSKLVDVRFDAPETSSDGGVLLLRELDERLGVCERLARRLPDERSADRVKHSRAEQVRQRIFQICAGYEDCNDADRLKSDPVFKASCGRSVGDDDLSSQPTLSRFENAVRIGDIRKLVTGFEQDWVESLPADRELVVLDIDGTADPTHGKQQLTFFHGFHDHYMYHPLLVFDAVDGALVTAILRPGNTHDCRGAVGVMDRLVRSIRAQCPTAKIVIRGDAGFAMPRMLLRLEQLDRELGQVEYVIGIARNSRLLEQGERWLKQASKQFAKSQQAVRVFGEFRYAAESWPRKRRVIMKAEHLPKGANPRFVVTSFEDEPVEVYEQLYCARGQCENLIKDLKNALCGDRLSCHNFSANWFRLLLYASAYRLMHALRQRLSAVSPRLGACQLDTLRLRLIKIAATVTESVRRLLVRLPASCPYAEVWCALSRRLAPD